MLYVKVQKWAADFVLPARDTQSTLDILTLKVDLVP